MGSVELGGFLVIRRAVGVERENLGGDLVGRMQVSGANRVCDYISWGSGGSIKAGRALAMVWRTAHPPSPSSADSA